MKRVAVFLSLFFISIALASDPNEVLRTADGTYKPLAATKSQAEALRKIDAKYDALLAKLRKDKPADYGIKRDSLNEKYTHDFIGAMTPIQKSNYRKYVRSLRQGYIKAHPEIDADNIFIWGAANVL